MRSYFLASLILVAVSILAGVITMTSFQAAKRARTELVDAREAVEGSDGIGFQKQIAAGSLARLQKETQPADAFIQHWQDSFMTEEAIQRIIPSLDSLAPPNLVSTSNKESSMDPGYQFKSEVIPVLTVKMSATGDFYRVLNWLGEVERLYPIARVESVVFSNEQGLKLTAVFSFPMIFKSSAPVTP